ncbi:MAG: tRNA (adenosine(37)-N6)-dimethylallyltransferase MiaA [Burkholderiaceae bacterium]|nr:MAG: tRNA (adenosine(37)-N6)-dimethylallyltransferase MiaA [Burkholderiaceae bacterium]
MYLTGPTAVGKSAVAMALAERLPVEIISVDSALVYRGMDIGTAKPSATERAAVAHHLIDIRDPAEPYSAAEFASDATRLMAEIRARRHVPLLVGGTLLYFRALLGGLDALPAANAAVREALEKRAQRLGWPALHAELARVDPAAAARLAPNDRQRIQRALEVWQQTGQPLSALQTGASGTAAKMRAPPHFFALEPTDRAWLHTRIALRFDQMLAAGLIDEVKRLNARGTLSADLPAMRCVGYRQVLDTLAGRAPAETLRERGIAATRQLAKRQLTWLRGIQGRQVLAVGGSSRTSILAAAILERINAAGN